MKAWALLSPGIWNTFHPFKNALKKKLKMMHDMQEVIYENNFLKLFFFEKYFSYWQELLSLLYIIAEIHAIPDIMVWFFNPNRILAIAYNMPYIFCYNSFCLKWDFVPCSFIFWFTCILIYESILRGMFIYPDNFHSLCGCFTYLLSS